MYFGVKLTARDRPLLEALQSFFGGIGNIYAVKPRAPTANGGYTKAASYYRVSRPDQLRRIIDHFDAYPLQSAKRESYVIWREMALLKRIYGRKAMDQLRELAVQLSAASTRNQPWEEIQASGDGNAANMPLIPIDKPITE